MTDDDLIARLRGKRERCHDLSGVYYTEDMDCQAAADRIEALVKERDALIAARDTMGNLWATWLRVIEAAANAEDQTNAERLLRVHLCIRAALKGDDHE